VVAPVIFPFITKVPGFIPPIVVPGGKTTVLFSEYICASPK
jgi:hypothetical protein